MPIALVTNMVWCVQYYFSTIKKLSHF